jgi:hypothetical protein
MKTILTAVTIALALAAVAEAKPAKRPQTTAAAETAAANVSYAALGRAVADARSMMTAAEVAALDAAMAVPTARYRGKVAGIEAVKKMGKVAAMLTDEDIHVRTIAALAASKLKTAAEQAAFEGAFQAVLEKVAGR